MLTIELLTQVGLPLLALVGGYAIRHAQGGKAKPAPKPADPGVPTPAPGNDPLAGLPGLPGHPVLNAILGKYPLLAAVAPAVIDEVGPHVQGMVRGVIRRAIQGVLDQPTPPPTVPLRQAA